MIAMEISELKLRLAPDLRCENRTSKVPICQACQSCLLAAKVAATREWFLRAGENSQRKFLFGVVRRMESADLLVYVGKVIRPALGKDFTYSRSRINPSLVQDLGAASSDRALNRQRLRQFMAETWDWLKNGSYWTKANYALLLLQMCSPNLLHNAANLIHLLIVRRRHPHTRLEAFALVRVSPDVHAKSQEETFGIDEPGHTEETNYSTQDDPSLMVVPTSFQSTSGVRKYKDFIRCLPVHLSKKILGYLIKKHLFSCLSVSRHWCYLTKELVLDLEAETLVRNEAMILQGTSYKGVSVSYAKVQPVPVPKVGEDGSILPRVERYYKDVKPGESVEAAYVETETETVFLEERNVFCGSYNVLILTGQGDPHRVIHFDGGKLVAAGSTDRKVKLYDMVEMSQVPPLIQGHSGSIRVVRLCEERGFVFSGGFDLSIRQWNLQTGVCLRIFHGHMKTITCLDVQADVLVSGAKDGHVKVWNITTGKCLRTFKHKEAVLAVKMKDQTVISGCEKGLVKIWNNESGQLCKTLTGHQGAIKCLSFDQWHLVSGGADGNAIAWSMLGTFQKRLMTFRHPKEVTCLEFLYLRVITGCADGKIRVFNFLNGDCLRVMRANSRADPVATMCIRHNRMVINVLTSIMIFQFEEVSWDYSQTSERVDALKERERFNSAPIRVRPYGYVRAQRMKRVGSSNRKLYQMDEEEDVEAKTQLSHHARSLSARSTKRAHDLHMKSLNPATWPELTNYRRSFAYIDLQPEFFKKPPSAYRPQTAGQSIPEVYSRASTAPAMKTKEDSDGESGYGSPGRKSALSMSESAALRRMKRRGRHTPMSPNQILLKVSTIQNLQKTDEIRTNLEHNSRIRDEWGAPASKNEYGNVAAQNSYSKESQPVDLSAILEYLKSSAAPVEMRKIMTAFEIRKLNLKMNESIHGPAVRSTIPAPAIVRPQTSFSYRKKQRSSALQRRSTSAVETTTKQIGLYTSLESLQPTRMIMGQRQERATTKRRVTEQVGSADPYRERAGFQLLTVKQLTEFHAKKMLQHKEVEALTQTMKTKESKKAWLMKIQGKNIDGFTKEGKIAAPEFGPDVYL
ncbi:PREDICTED: CMT1A duplicated region transcript 1 protein [Nanorana parkeri]|uniref:CMT1A duplicated region transcript 1 protein n=1 Tax=Nanorana parkeri TaxID=125878 RepID=UPI0008540AEA|nr:PREDICTED: CMT1A duplicated region transcript 1 protein [Nanorana parkeri]